MKTKPALLAALFSVLLLCACTTTSGMIDPNTLYPDAITHCAKEPEVPKRPAPNVARSDKDKAQYVENLHSAWQDCNDTVGDVANRKQLYVEQYKNQTEDFFSRSWDQITNGLSSISPF